MAVNYAQELDLIVQEVASRDASDIHFAVGRHPTLRIMGELEPLTSKPVLTAEDIMAFAEIVAEKNRLEIFQESLEADFSYEDSKQNRFRGHIFYQKENPGLVLRYIPREIRTIEELNLPPILYSFAQKRQGFFLCVGPVGQGKSTTLAAMVDYINQNRAEHIVTIEDPIEYVYEPQKSMIDQREVGIDTHTFQDGLSSAFRQDVNVLLIGEMRNRDTISTAVTAAETGHLVFSTLHTNNAAQTLNRIIDTFPGSVQDQIRVQLAGSLAGIFSQRLIPRIDGGLIPAYELLVNNNAVSNLIREDRIHEINAVIETGLEQGMLDMNRSLVDLVKKGIISVEDAFAHSFNPKALERLI
jgi:twitching motility protein PilT